VAKRPPSSGTSGRSSGGMTGTCVKIIHSGRLPDSMKLSTILRRLASFFGLRSPVATLSSSRNCSRSFSRLIAINISRMASAPMPAVKLSSP
jgi:hypothetical protein